MLTPDEGTGAQPMPFDRTSGAQAADDPQHAAPEVAEVNMRVVGPAFTDAFRYGEVTVTREWSPVPADVAAEFGSAAIESGISIEQEG